MFEDQDNELDYTAKFRLDSSNDAERLRARTSKAERNNRRPRKNALPGNIRLRRNKHWNW